MQRGQRDEGLGALGQAPELLALVHRLACRGAAAAGGTDGPGAGVSSRTRRIEAQRDAPRAHTVPGRRNGCLLPRRGPHKMNWRAAWCTCARAAWQYTLWTDARMRQRGCTAVHRDSKRPWARTAAGRTQPAHRPVAGSITLPTAMERRYMLPRVARNSRRSKAARRSRGTRPAMLPRRPTLGSYCRQGSEGRGGLEGGRCTGGRICGGKRAAGGAHVCNARATDAAVVVCRCPVGRVHAWLRPPGLGLGFTGLLTCAQPDYAYLEFPPHSDAYTTSLARAACYVIR